MKHLLKSDLWPAVPCSLEPGLIVLLSSKWKGKTKIMTIGQELA